jgi:hypothetical protein
MPQITAGLRATADADQVVRTIQRTDPLATCLVKGATVICDTERPEIVMRQYPALVSLSRWVNINMG